MSNALKRMAVVLLTVASIGLSGCKADISASPTASPDIGAKMQQYEQFSAKLFAVMTFESAGTAVTVPTELGVTAVPIEWMGLTFTGLVRNVGPGSNVTEQVHGTVSDDGQWISSLTYSRKLIMSSANSGFQYTVTLRNLQIPGGDTFEVTGSEVQKYVVKIEFQQGSLNNGQIVESMKYLSADWKNVDKGQVPAFSLSLLKVSGLSPWGTNAPQTGGGMGKP